MKAIGCWIRRNVECALRVTVLRGHVAVLTRLRSRVRTNFILITTIKPFEIGHLFEVRFIRIGLGVIHQRHVDRVAVAAHARALDVCIVFRLDAERVVHRVGNNLCVQEWSKQVRRIADSKIPFNFIFQKIEEWISSVWRRFVFDNSMTSQTANAIPCQRSVNRLLCFFKAYALLSGPRLYHLRRKI
jgi:hypothetical protein